MPTTLFRVVHQGLVNRSLLIDKVDKSQGNSEGYARKAKQAIYVPRTNSVDTTVAGYIDMVPTDEVLLSSNNGTLAGLVTAGHVTVTAFNSTLKATPVITNVVHAAAAAVGGQTGSAASITTVVSGVATVTGLTGMVTGSVGHDLEISGAASGANNGTFRIVEYVSATSVKIANTSAVASDANNGSIVWTEYTVDRTTITGTTFASLSPDVTYVTLTNASNVSQVFTDQALIAAVDPTSFSTSSIVIADELVTIGTPTTGWKVTIMANSKTSNTFTL